MARIRCQLYDTDPQRPSIIVLWINDHKTIIPATQWHECVDRLCYAGDRLEERQLARTNHAAVANVHAQMRAREAVTANV